MQPLGTQPTPPTETTPVVPKSGLINPNRIYQPRAAQNLVNPTIVVDRSSSQNQWKAIVLDVVAVVLAAALGYSFARYLAGGFSFWFVFAALLLWGAVSVIEGFLQKQFSRRFVVIFFESLALVAFFYAYAWQALAIAALAVMVCLLWGYGSVRRELGNTVEIRFFTASGRIMGKVITAAIIFMIVMYASLANNQGSFFVSENGFNLFFTWASGFVNNFYPTVPLNGSVGDFAKAIVRIQLQGNQQFQKLPQDQQDAVLAQSADQLIGTFSNESSTDMAVGTSTATSTAPGTITSTEPVSNAFYDYLVRAMQKLQARFSNLFIGAWGLVLFLILRSIGIIVVWIGQFVSLIFYELLLATGFMKIKEQTTSKETIEY